VKSNLETAMFQGVIFCGLGVFPMASVFLHTIYYFAAT
jgi:hypothetical protein